MPDSFLLNRPASGERGSPARWWVLGTLVVALLAVFVGRTYLARTGQPPRIFEIFEMGIAGASAVVLLMSYRRLERADWLAGLGLGLFVGVQLPFATLFQAYPFLDVVHGDGAQAVIRGTLTALAALGGLAIRRGGGPVQLHLAGGGWRRAAGAFLFGAVVGMPLAVLNSFANSWVQQRPFDWQQPLAAAVDALQPALVEEVVYRLAFLGLAWLLLRRYWPERQAAWLAGILALLVFTYAHYSDEFLTQPLATLAMGGVMGLIWGVPLTLLALRRDLDSAVGFHWMQDFARFWAGF